jgi:hypothetical protein
LGHAANNKSAGKNYVQAMSDIPQVRIWFKNGLA